MKNLPQLSTNGIMEKISQYAPFSILLFALLSFIAVGVFKVDYYTEKFGTRFDNAMAMAIVMAVISEGVRAALLITSSRDFINGEKTNGWLGLLASVGIVIYEWNVAGNIATVWSAEAPELYKGIFLFLIIVGLVLELRLVLTLSVGSSQTATNKRTTANGVLIPATNYNGTKATQNSHTEAPARNQIGFFPTGNTNVGKDADTTIIKSVATQQTAGQSSGAIEQSELIEMALKNAKRFLSAYESKPDTTNNISKRKEWKEKVEVLESMLV
jgi:hypothetical protein